MAGARNRAGGGAGTVSSLLWRGRAQEVVPSWVTVTTILPTWPLASM